MANISENSSNGVLHLVIDKMGSTFDNDETKRMSKLIGKQLTKIEIVDGNVYLEFDSFGCITVIPRMTVEVVTSVRQEII
jgi:ribosome maturation factor RimP